MKITAAAAILWCLVVWDTTAIGKNNQHRATAANSLRENSDSLNDIGTISNPTRPSVPGGSSTGGNAALICLSPFELLSNDPCNYQSIYGMVDSRLRSAGAVCNGHTARRELSMMLAVREDDVEDEVASRCLAASNSYFTNYGLTIDEALRYNRAQTKEFFDGGTIMNGGRETIVEHQHVDDDLEDLYKETIERVHSIHAQQGLIHWPGEPTSQLGGKPGISNFQDCELRAAMCCWVQDRQADDNNGDCARPYDQNCVDADPADNTDICLVDMSNAPDSARVKNGYALYPNDNDEGEGPAHCHGFAWASNAKDPSAIYKGNNLYHVSVYDHFMKRGYVRNVPGAPMCGCIEKMPVVSRSDCTQVNPGNSYFRFEYSPLGGFVCTLSYVDVSFGACEGINQNNDLYDHYKKLRTEGKVTSTELQKLSNYLVGGGSGCSNAIRSLVNEKL